jgi:hypothetical protein
MDLVHLPRWMPYAATVLTLVSGLVIVAAQLIAAATGSGGGIAPTPADSRAGAALVALMLSPIWIGSASMAVLGTVLHYVLDNLLNFLKISFTAREGLAWGIRAAWATVGLLMLGFGLQATYQRAIANDGATIDSVVSQADLMRFFLSLLAVIAGLMALVTPSLIEGRAQRDTRPTSSPTGSAGPDR